MPPPHVGSPRRTSTTQMEQRARWAGCDPRRTRARRRCPPPTSPSWTTSTARVLLGLAHIPSLAPPSRILAREIRPDQSAPHSKRGPKHTPFPPSPRLLLPPSRPRLL